VTIVPLFTTLDAVTVPLQMPAWPGAEQSSLLRTAVFIQILSQAETSCQNGCAEVLKEQRS
jgi:hypothetical protein